MLPAGLPMEHCHPGITTGNLDANGDNDWIKVDLVAANVINSRIRPYGAWLKLKGSAENGNRWIQKNLERLDTVENPFSENPETDIGQDINNAHDIDFGDPGHGSVAMMGGLISKGDKDWISVDLTEGYVYQAYVVGRPSNLWGNAGS